MAYLGPSASAPKPYEQGSLWWEGAKDKAHERVCGVVDYLWETPEEKARRAEDVDHARLYGNKYFRGFGPFQFAKPVPSHRAEERLRANVIKPVVNTAAALIAGRNRPKATLLTNGGDWSQKRRAKKADRFIEGAFHDAGVTSKMPIAFRDCALFGTGVVKFAAAHGKITCERVLPCEMLVDPIDGMYEQPRCVYQVKYVDKRVLLELYGNGSPAKRRAILDASLAKDRESSACSTTAEPVRVIEAWHLPSGPDADDGRHAIVIDGCTLLYEDWTRDRFPFVFLRWEHRVLGFWGVGLVEDLKPIQLDVNITLRRIKECLHLMAIPRIFVQQTAKAIKSLITNEVGAIIPYAGSSPPTFLTPPSVPPELFAHLRWLISQAFEQAGVSAMSATSQKPAGLNSGEAIRQYNDLGSERFAVVSREYEQAHLEAARVVMDLAAELAESNEKGFAATYVTRQNAQKIAWADVELDQDSYTLQVQPTSALPRDVAGRTATIKEWVAEGFVDQQRAKRLLDFPDLDSDSDLEFAGQEIVDMKLERILDHEEIDEAYHGPAPYDDLVYGLRRAQQTLNKQSMEGAPEDRLEMLRQFITDAEALLETAAGPPANAVPAVAPGGAAPGVPAAMPPVTGMAA